MINIKAPLQSVSFHSRPAPSLNISRMAKSPIKKFKKNSPAQKFSPTTSFSKTFHVKKNELYKYIETLEWRTRTQFPIVKVKNWKVLSKQKPNWETEPEILIEVEGSFKSLQNFPKISFTQAIYIIKESLIGFERLWYYFGSFHFDPNMIKFNEVGVCKVWINQDCYSNDLNPRDIVTEKQFILELCSAIKNKITTSRSAKTFFSIIQNCEYFFQAIGKIESFTESYLINVPNFIQNLDESKSPLVKASKNFSPSQKKENQQLSSKIPSFLKKNKQDKNSPNRTLNFSPKSNSFGKKSNFFGKKSNSFGKKTGIFDRSSTHTNYKFSSYMYSSNQSNLKQNNLKNQQKIDDQMSSFFEGLKMRLLQPNQQNQKFVSSQNIFGQNKKIQVNPQSNKDFRQNILEINLSFKNKSPLNQRQMPQIRDDDPLNESSPNIVFKQTQSPQYKRLNLSLMQNHISSPFTSKYIKKSSTIKENLKNENHQDKVKDFSTQSLKIKQFRSNKKYSREISSFSVEKKHKNQQIFKSKVPSFLTNLKTNEKSSLFTKSPSLQVISPSLNLLQTKKNDQDKPFLMEQLMIGSNQENDEKKKSEKIIKNHLSGIKETIEQEKREPEEKKLGFQSPGKNESSDTEEGEFEEEYVSKIRKQKSVRNQILNILN